jgi:hypothetical protein
MHRKILEVAFLALCLAGCAGMGESNVFQKLYLIICKPSPDQQVTAQKQVQHYLAGVQSGKRRAATHRYIAVRTSNPTTKQRLVYVTKRVNAEAAAQKKGEALSPAWVNPPELKCLMVFDTQFHQFVGTGCYVVGTLPSEGQVTQFESVSAEYVGTGTADSF